MKIALFEKKNVYELEVNGVKILLNENNEFYSTNNSSKIVLQENKC